MEVQIVGKQRLELQADQRSLGNHGPVLLLDGEEVLVGIPMGEDHGLATERTDLRTADIEHVAMASQIGQAHIVALCHQTVAQTGPVDIQGDLVALTDLVEFVEFLGRVERAEFRGEGDIHQSWVHGMVLVAVVHIVVEVFVEHLRLHLTLCVGQGDDLMLRELHGTGLVHVDMA